MRGAGTTVFSRGLAAGLLCLLLGSGAQAALFEDDEARKAILDLRNRLHAGRGALDAHARPRARSSCSRCGAACWK